MRERKYSKARAKDKEKRLTADRGRGMTTGLLTAQTFCILQLPHRMSMQSHTAVCFLCRFMREFISQNAFICLCRPHSHLMPEVNLFCIKVSHKDTTGTGILTCSSLKPKLWLIEIYFFLGGGGFMR